MEEQAGDSPRPASAAGEAATDSDSAGESGRRSAGSAADRSGAADTGRKRCSFMIADVLRPTSPGSGSSGSERAETGSERGEAGAETGAETGGEPAPQSPDASFSILASIQRIVENHAKMLESRAPPPLDRRKASTAAAAAGAGGDNNRWPAWVYCTRYSDRPSSGPRVRKVKKRKPPEEKRPRTAFTSEQLARLKVEFQENRYLTEKRRQDLAQELSLNESQIKIWFQNKRAKIKKSMGLRNPLALSLMSEGLYNHATVPIDEED